MVQQLWEVRFGTFSELCGRKEAIHSVPVGMCITPANRAWASDSGDCSDGLLKDSVLKVATMSDTFDPYHKWLGIPPVEQPPNHYRLLGVSLFEADPEVIANAADQRVLHVRTFQIGMHTEESQRILKEIFVARVCLLSAEKKAQYDACLRSVVPAPPLMPPSETLLAFKSAPNVPGLATVVQSSSPNQDARNWFRVPSAVAAMKAIVGAICGLVIAYCLFLFVLRSNIFDRLDSRQVTDKAAGPAELQTKNDKSEQKSDMSERAASKPGRGEFVTPMKPAPVVAAVDQVGGDEPATAEQAKPSEKASTVQPSLTPLPLGGRSEQERNKTIPPDSSASDLASTMAKKPNAGSPTVSETPISAPERAFPIQPVAETLEQAVERLRADAARALSIAEHQAVAGEALTMAYHAILESKAELARQLTTLALTAARKSNAADAKRQATLLLVELDQPISDVLKAHARKSLSKGALETPDAAVPALLSSGAAPSDASLNPKSDERAKPATTLAEQRPQSEAASVADLGSQVVGTAEFARREQAREVFKEFEAVVHEVFCASFDSLQGRPFTHGYSYSENLGELTHTSNRSIAVRNFPETETRVFVSASIISDDVVVRASTGSAGDPRGRRTDSREIGRVSLSTPRDWSDIKRLLRLEALRIVEEVVRPKLPKPGPG